MKIALIGYGKMGKMVEQAVLAKGHEISARVNSQNPISNCLNRKSLAQTDLFIDFSHPDCALDHIKYAAELKKNIVVGTTGWLDQLDAAKAVVEKGGIGLLHSPNFSLGIALFMKILAAAAQYTAPYDFYDVAGVEIHHHQKVDAPSGTAKALEKILSKHIPRKKDMQFSSIRVGSVPGTHTVIFDSPFDTITLTHTARSREGFAQGAVAAAEWLIGRKGFFTLDDML